MIKCEICGKRFMTLGSHVQMHNITPEEYKKKYNLKTLHSKEYSDRIVSSLNKIWEDPEKRNKQSKILLNYFEEHPEESDKMSKRYKEVWKREGYREKQGKSKKAEWEREGYRDRQRESHIRYAIENPEAMKKHGECISELYKNLEYKEKARERARNIWERPNYRNNMSKIIKEKWQESDYAEMQSELHRKYFIEHPEVLVEMSERHKNKWKDPEFRNNLSGENHYSWRGGKEACKKRLALKRQRLGYVPLFDNPFPDEVRVDSHHINDMLVVPMPTTIHRYVCGTGQNVPEHRERCNL